jgi:Xaa-Pro aminopeptidase
MNAHDGTQPGTATRRTINAHARQDLGLPYPFDETTYRARLARVRESLRRRGSGGLLIFDQASMFYLFGYDQLGYWVFQAVWVPTSESEPVQGICRAPDRELMARGVGIDEVRVWLDDDRESPTATLMRWARESGANRIDVELASHALRGDYVRELYLHAESCGISLESGDEVVLALREVKDDGELDLMRAAGRALDRAYLAVEERIAPGVLETELSSAVLAALLAEGCDPASVPPCISAGSRTLAQTHLSAKPLPVPEADIVTVELGAAKERYHAVAFQTYFMEGAPRAYLDQYRAIRDTVLAGVEELVPGRNAAEVAGSIHDRLVRAGSGRVGRHVGYGTGIGFAPTWLEGLRIKRSQEYELQPGMTFFLFAGAPTLDGARHMGYGVPVAVTANGPELLSSHV